MASFARAISSTFDHSSEHLCSFISCFKPMIEKSSQGRKLLIYGWGVADPNGNGLCSLAELENFVKVKLESGYPKNSKLGSTNGLELWAYFRPCYIRAFNDAKDYKKDDGTIIEGTNGSTADDFVSKAEFRLFCGYLCIYAAMYDGFSRIDGFGAGKEGDDRRIDMSEWIAGYRKISDLGFVALANVVDDTTALEAWKLMDINGGGFVLFDEWCTYLKAAEVNQGSSIGALLAVEE